jgi:hypothetical protein
MPFDAVMRATDQAARLRGAGQIDVEVTWGTSRHPAVFGRWDSTAAANPPRPQTAAVLAPLEKLGVRCARIVLRPGRRSAMMLNQPAPLVVAIEAAAGRADEEGWPTPGRRGPGHARVDGAGRDADPDRGRDQDRGVMRRAWNKDGECRNCGAYGRLRLERCDNCYVYFHKHDQERPSDYGRFQIPPSTVLPDGSIAIFEE